MTFTDIIAVVGLVTTVGFGIYSVATGKAKQPKAGMLFLVLAFLYGAQFVSAKFLGHVLLPDSSFSMLVTMMVIGIYWLIRDTQE